MTEKGVFGGQAEQVSAEEVRRAMKFRNGDVSLDEAVKSIKEDVAKTGKPFTIPNADLLAYAVANTPWD
jgi:hypothetical protein